MPDHYATLGVPPNAKTAAIRAAYLTLMREYHPDRNPDPAATVRAQAAIAAFKVLGDFDRRNHYDWDRRREREAAEAAAAKTKRPRRIRAGVVGAGAIGLAAVGALVLMPAPPPEPRRIDPPVADLRPAPVAKAKPVLAPKRVAVASPVETTVKAQVDVPKAESRAKPKRVATIEPVRPKPAKAERAPRVVRSVVVKASAPRVVPVPVPVPPPPPIRAAARPATTDLASLDQFVMYFYGQSWRYGTAPKRAALAQSRSKFVARRGACVADACKRDAYLKLMRDVSAIVENGQPKAR